MLIALLVSYLLSGNSLFASQITEDNLDAIADRIEIMIEDPETVSASEDILDVAADELKDFEKLFSKSGKALTKQYKDHEATTDVMLAELETLNTGWAATQSQLLQQRFALKALLTEDQWNELFEQ